MSLGTVWKSLNSQPIDHLRRTAFNEQVLRFSHTQQSTVCLQFAWRTTSLRVGGLAARRSCLSGLRRGGGRQAGAVVLSCLMWRCESSRPDNCVLRRSASSGRTAPPDTLRHRPDTERTCLAVGPTQFTPPHQTRQNSPVCVVSGVPV